MFFVHHYNKTTSSVVASGGRSWNQSSAPTKTSSVHPTYDPHSVHHQQYKTAAPEHHISLSLKPLGH